MKLSVDFNRWTVTKAALTAAGALAIGGAVGSAIAMSPVITPPIKWAGGWEVARPALTGDTTLLYTSLRTASERGKSQTTPLSVLAPADYLQRPV